MKYKVVVQHSDFGYSVSYPFFPGCHSQGSTLEEALENITDAIQNYKSMLEMKYQNQETYEVMA